MLYSYNLSLVISTHKEYTYIPLPWVLLLSIAKLAQ